MVIYVHVYNPEWQIFLFELQSSPDKKQRILLSTFSPLLPMNLLRLKLILGLILACWMANGYNAERGD